MSPTSFRNWCISREVPFDQVGATCQVGSRHGSAGLGAGLTPPLGPPGCMSRRTVPRDWLQHHCVPRLCGPAYNRWVCLESLKKYVTKMTSSSRRFVGFRHTPVAPGCSSPVCDTTRTVAHQTDRVVAFFAMDVRVSCFYRDSCAKSGGPGTVVPGLPQNRT